MTVLAVTSRRGAPGCTTAALVLAAVATERGPSLLVEADPAGGVLVARCPALTGSPGVEQLAFPATVAADRAAGIESAVQRLGDLAVLVGSHDPWRAEAALSSPRVAWSSVLPEQDGTVVVDVGRSYRGSPTGDLLRPADLVVLVCRPEPLDVLHARDWLDQLPGEGGRRGVVVTVGDEAGVSPMDELGAGWWGRLPLDARAVALLERGGSTRHRALRRSPLVRATRDLWSALPAESATVEVRR